MVGDMAHSGQRADGGAALIDHDPVQPLEMGDVDQRLGLGDAAFREIDQRGAAGEQHGTGQGGRLACRIERTGAQIGKIPHDATSMAAWRTAATMCG